MRLDYILYGLSIVLFIVAAISYLVISDLNTQIIVAVSVAIWGVIFFVIGYLLKPKIQVMQIPPPAADVPRETVPEPTQKETVEELKEEISKPQTVEIMPAPELEQPTIQEIAQVAPVNMVELTQIKGIGEKRAAQLKSNGINNALDLAKCNVADLAEKLKISPKFIEKWITAAKEQTK